MSAAPAPPIAPTALATRRAAAYTPAMPVSLATVARLMLVLALAFNGWAPPAHAHAAVPLAAVSAESVASVPDCHREAKGLKGFDATANSGCCAAGICQGCNCVMACATALPVSGSSSTQWASSPAPGIGAAGAPGACPTGNPLRPPIA